MATKRTTTTPPETKALRGAPENKATAPAVAPVVPPADTTHEQDAPQDPQDQPPTPAPEAAPTRGGFGFIAPPAAPKEG